MEYLRRNPEIGWRLSRDEDSLIYKMLKARYFPDTSFLEAEKGKTPSNTWSAILWGKELLNAGVRWRVSNGASVRVFQDPWVPTVPNFRIDWKVGFNWNMRVSELITDTGEWDCGKLDQIGTMDEVAAILSIPLVRSQGQDKLLWNWTKSGKFSVKSAYWLAVKEKRDHAPVPVVSEHC